MRLPLPVRVFRNRRKRLPRGKLPVVRSKKVLVRGVKEKAKRAPRLQVLLYLPRRSKPLRLQQIEKVSEHPHLPREKFKKLISADMERRYNIPYLPPRNPLPPPPHLQNEQLLKMAHLFKATPILYRLRGRPVPLQKALPCVPLPCAKFSEVPPVPVLPPPHPFPPHL